MDQLSTIFSALADASRLRILNILFHSGELCVCDIERIMKFTQTKVSRHLGYLKRAGLVEDRRQGLWMLYRIAEPADETHRAVITTVRELLLSNPHARRDAEELRRTISTGCCTTFSVIKPDQIPVELKLT